MMIQFTDAYMRQPASICYSMQHEYLRGILKSIYDVGASRKTTCGWS